MPDGRLTPEIQQRARNNWCSEGKRYCTESYEDKRALLAELAALREDLATAERGLRATNDAAALYRQERDTLLARLEADAPRSAQALLEGIDFIHREDEDESHALLDKLGIERTDDEGEFALVERLRLLVPPGPPSPPAGARALLYQRSLEERVRLLEAALTEIAERAKLLTFAMREARGGFVDERGDWLTTVEVTLPQVEAAIAGADVALAAPADREQT